MLLTLAARLVPLVTFFDPRYGLGGNYKSVPDRALAAKMESSRKQMYYMNRCGKLLLLVVVVVIVSLCPMKACNNWRNPCSNQSPKASFLLAYSHPVCA